MSAEVVDGTTPALLLLLRTGARSWAHWERTLNEAVFVGLEWLGCDEIREPNPVTRHWPLVSNPAMVLVWMVAYLAFVFGGLAFWRSAAGERLRSKRQGVDPTWLRFFVQAHNLFLIASSAFIMVGSAYEAWKNGYKFWGTPYNPREVEMSKLIYFFFVLKLYEYFDTVIMVLKGNTRQISFLHCYHHMTISFIWWIIARIVPGGEAWYSASLNSFIHVLMYTYYFMATMIGKNEKRKKKYLWWGKYLTQLQMTQFVTMMGQALYTFYFTDYPLFISRFYFWYMQTLLVLFSNFYVRKHLMPKKNSKSE